MTREKEKIESELVKAREGIDQLVKEKQADTKAKMALRFRCLLHTGKA